MTFDPSNKGSSISLFSNNLLAASSSSDWDSAISIVSESSGKIYFEMYIEQQGDTNDNFIVGISNDDGNQTPYTRDTYPGGDTDSWGIRGFNGDKYFNGTPTATDSSGFGVADTVNCCIDIPNKKIWFGVNNTYVDSGNPAAGTNPAFESPDVTGTDFFAALGLYTASGTMTARLRLHSSDWVYSAPSGFSAMSGTRVTTTTTTTTTA
jgi:hypothetical protein